MRIGFRGIDTANQRRHYHAAAVGSAISAVVANGLVARDDLLVQTKFTFPHGPDHRVPYGVDAPIAVQVEQSLASSPRPPGHRHDGLLLVARSDQASSSSPIGSTWPLVRGKRRF